MKPTAQQTLSENPPPPFSPPPLTAPSDMALFTAILPVRSSVNNGTRSLRVLRTLYERAQDERGFRVAGHA